jgi:hypothetical protein
VFRVSVFRVPVDHRVGDPEAAKANGSASSGSGTRRLAAMSTNQTE